MSRVLSKKQMSAGAVTIFGTAIFLLSAAGVVDAKPDHAAAPSAVDSGICFVDRQSTTTTQPSIGAGVEVKVSVVVVANTRMRLNDSGQVTEVGTNSGCAPASSDEFIVETGAETYRAATADEAEAAFGCRVTGPWEDTSKWHKCHKAVPASVRS